MNFYSVDKIVDEKVVLEMPDKSFSTFLLSDLPEGLKEGDLLYKTDEGFEIDENATRKRRKKLYDLQNSLFNNQDL